MAESDFKVHPRIRGEYGAGRRKPCGRRGSPPHTRGILVTFTLVNVHAGFTPAYAGNTVSGSAQ